MRVVFSEHAWEDYQYWLKTDRRMLQRINMLIKEIQRTPYEGIGKPEKLRYALAGVWSRRINEEHRLVYRIVDGDLLIVQVRYHY